MNLDPKNRQKLESLNNSHVSRIVEHYIRLCKPSSVSVITDSGEDISYIRRKARENGEESQLSMKGHTVHFDGYLDQGRDPLNTKVLVPEGQKAASKIVSGDREACLKEIFTLLEGIMAGREMIIRFFCLGPLNSKFSLLALQITDSAYVAHSEDLLYRPGYESFRALNGKDNFFHFVHSTGPTENNRSVDTSKRRVYMDMAANRVFSVNTQYAGNSLGLKKLALRLAIKKSNDEDWLCEHMLIVGVRPEGKARTTYFTGAFPSACGKTSTAMIPGNTIIGDDIAYIRIGKDGKAHAVNVETGIFGIIEDINPIDDPLIYKALTSPRELVFSNVLVSNGTPYWLGMGRETPEAGENFSGTWKRGDKDKDGKDIPPAHRNARYTLKIKDLDNFDPRIDDPEGVPISGIIYGGRDYETSPPVVESFGWSHGVFGGAALESQTTQATIGKIDVSRHDPMANMDFLVVPLGQYIRNHLKFGERAVVPPRVFFTNYFLKDGGKYLNHKLDKKVWLLWMEGRVHSEYGAIECPVGLLPKYEDLKALFMATFSREYCKEDYVRQFSIRTGKLLQRLDRIEAIYRAEESIPEGFLAHLSEQRERLMQCRKKYGKDTVSPLEF
jgi:phosphoenolpyruvate carboxykinase (GTP)